MRDSKHEEIQSNEQLDRSRNSSDGKDPLAARSLLILFSVSEFSEGPCCDDGILHSGRRRVLHHAKLLHCATSLHSSAKYGFRFSFYDEIE